MRVFASAFLIFAFLAGMVPAYGAQTTVGRVETSVSPTQPMAGDTYYVTTRLFPSGNGSWCTATVRATVAGITSLPKSTSIHNPNASGALVFSFDLSGISSGADLTPTISVSGCGNGSFSGVSGGVTTPTLQPSRVPALSIVKRLSGSNKSLVSPGDVVTYKLEYTSSGSAVAPSVVLTDTLDPGLLFISATGGGSASGQTVTWNLGDLDPGNSNSVEVTARIAPTATTGVIDNSARIRANGVTEIPSNTVSITVDANPNIRLTKTINDDVTQAAVLEAGRVVTYQIKYENLGGADAANVVITDQLPIELVGTPSLGGHVSRNYDPATRIATFNIGQVARKASGVVTLTAQIDPSLGNIDFDNVAEATFTGGTSNKALANISVAAEPNLEVTKSAQPTLVAPGDTLSYTISYRNIGSIIADNPVIEDQLPIGIEPIPGTFSGSYDAGTRIIRWSLPDLAPGAQMHSVSYQVAVDSGLLDTDLFNQVTMTASNLPRFLTAVAITTVQVRQKPVLVPEKQLAAGTPNVVLDGDTVVYEIAVANTGKEGTDGGVTITDTLPPGLSFVSASAGGSESPPGVVTWNLADLAPNSVTGTVTLEARVVGSLLNDGDFLSNAVEVAAQDQFVRQYRESSNHALVQYNAPPSVSITKTANPPETTPLRPGDIVDYTITATLQSKQGVTDLGIIDLLPPQLEFIKANDPGVSTTTSATGTQVAWPVAALGSGSRSVTLQARVRGGLSPGEAITNIAGATFGAGTGFASPDSVQHFLSDAAVRLGKSIPPDQTAVINGEEIDYTIDYTNTGKVTLTGIRLQDTLPDGVVLVAATPSATSTVPGPPTVLRWNLPDLAPGQSNAVSVKVRVDGAAPGTVLRNQAQIDTNETQPSTTPPVVSNVREAPVLALTKTASAGTLHPGDSVDFTVTFENTGKGEALNVVLTDTFPGSLTFVSASDQVTPAAGKISWNLGTLAPGASGSKTIRATVPAGSYVPAVAITNRVDIQSDKTAATAAATVTVTELPAFTLTKSVDRAHAAPGDTLHYTLTLEKTGGPATDVVVGDILPFNATYVSGTASPQLSGNSNIANGFLVWELGNMPDGPASASITFNASIDTVLPNGTALNNRAAVAANETNAILSNPVTTTVDSSPALGMKKTASTTSLFSPTTASGGTGDQIVYTITATNTGNAIATGVTITDTLPQELVIDPGSTTATVSGQTATWSIPTLPPGQPVTLTVAARVANGITDGTKLRNTASIATTMPGVGGAVSLPSVVVVQGEPQLELTKTASANSVKAGKELTYTLDYRNSGTAASGPITIEDLIPPETSFVSASDGGADSGNGHVTWTLPALQAGQSGSVSLTLAVNSIVPNGTKLRNVATAWESGNSSNAVKATIVGKPVIVSSQPILEIEKTSEFGSTIVAGGKASFNIIYRNVGSDTATNVIVIDTLPPGLSLVSASGTPAVSGNKLTWNFGNVAAQTSGNVKVTVRAANTLTDGKVLTNSASITSTEQPLPLADTAALTVRNAVLALTKSADKATARSGVSATSTPGEQVTYTLDYGNLGNAASTNTVLRDVLPANSIFVSSTPQPASVAGSTVTWNLGTLPAGSSGQVVLVTRVADDLRDGTLLHNTASISSDTTPSTAATPVDTVVSSQPVLTISKASTVKQVTPGQTYAYDITVRNTGSDLARNLVITDSLPAETAFVSATGGGLHSGGTVTWNIAELQPNTTFTAHVEVQTAGVIDNGTPLLNIVSVIGDNSSGGPTPPTQAILLIPVTSSPLLDIDYAVDRTTVAPGGALLYSLTVRNTGNAIANNVTVSASVPPNALPQSIDSFGSFVGNSAVWTIGTLPPSGAIRLQFSVFISSGVSDGTGEGSLASVQSSNAPTASASVLSVISARPDFTISKTAPNSVNAGDPIEYFIDYFNQGSGVASNVVVEDNLPAFTTFVSADNGGSQASVGVVRWNLGDVPPLTGGRLAVTVATTSGAIDGTTIDNTVSITGSNAGNRIAQATTIERSHTELAVTIVANQDPVSAGTQETLTVTWANTGNQDTTNAVVTATLPADTTFASATGGGSFNGTDLISWPVGNLPAGASGSATFTVNVRTGLLNGTVLKSVASITARDGQPRSADAPFMVSSTPIWVISKSASAATVDAGGQLTFTIVLRNLGNEAATGVVVTDNLPAGLQVLSADNGGTVDSSGNSVTWNLGTVAVGSQPITLTLRARMVAANTTLTNVALLSSNELPPVSVSASVDAGAAQPIPVLPWPALLLLMLLLVALSGARLRSRD